MQHLLLALVAVALATPDFNLINKVNSVQNEWRASPDSPTASLTAQEKHALLGTFRHGGPQLPIKTFTQAEIAAVPAAFDSRTNWPNCPTIQAIRDQSTCGSCWAFGAVESMSDRECTYNNRTVTLSAEDMNSCATSAGSCDGGYPSSAFQYWKNTGVVTESCFPYSLPSCDHHIANSTDPCPSIDSPTPPCKKLCQNGATWSADKHFASSVYTVSGEANMMTEIAAHGPCEVAFDVYSDFLSYVSGIYHKVGGTYEGGHAVKVIGWGVENNVKYWIIANSWNPHWGERGFFRIRKGNNECGIEDNADCGVPKP
jgi:cathepsin B